MPRREGHDEFQRIARFTARFPCRPSPAGPGDDAAVVARPPRGELEVVTTDAIVEGVHFTRRTFSFEDVGHKALAVNLSDLAAMGARPTWFVCAMTVPDDVGSAELDAVARGMARLARAHGIELVGGNLSRSLQLSITITAAGTTRRPLTRSGARRGDRLYVSGPLGAAAGGLMALEERRTSGARLALAQRRPSPHLAWIHTVSGLVSAAIDVSDGLIQDVGHLARASGLKAQLEARAIPVEPQLEAAVGGTAEALRIALTGGEDYVLVVAVPREVEGTFRGRLARAGFTAWRIGELVNGQGVWLDQRPVSAKLSGFRHFR